MDPSKIADSVRALYSAHPDLSVISNLYTEDAVFTDNITKVSGHEMIKRQFFLLSKLAYEIVLTDYVYSTSEMVNNRRQIIMNGVQKYAFSRFLPYYEFRVVTILTVNNEGKIVKHEDVWSVKSMISNAPVAGWVYNNIFRKGVSLVTDRIACMWESCGVFCKRVSQEYYTSYMATLKEKQM